MKINIYKPNKVFRKTVYVSISIVLILALTSSVLADLSVGIKRGAG